MADANRVDEFVQLFTRYETRLRSFALSLVANTADADDVLQQAYVTLWKRFDQFRSGTDFMAWAGRVIYLHVLRHRRRQSREKVVFDDAFVEAVADVTTEATFAAELGDRERALAECVGRLPPASRALLRARYEDGCSTESMAELFNRSAQGIYNALFRIRRKLFDCVDEKVRREVGHGR